MALNRELIELRVKVGMQQAEIERLTDLLKRMTPAPPPPVLMPSPQLGTFAQQGPATAASLDLDEDVTSPEAAVASLFGDTTEIQWADNVGDKTASEE
jgi:hypothetical protein